MCWCVAASVFLDLSLCAQFAYLKLGGVRGCWRGLARMDVYPNVRASARWYKIRVLKFI